MTEFHKEQRSINQVIKAQDELESLTAENAKLRGTLKELLLAHPDCHWRKCWGCGKKQIHREAVTPGVLCRFCGSQDTRLLKQETESLRTAFEEAHWANYVSTRHKKRADEIAEIVQRHGDNNRAIVAELKDVGIISQTTYWPDVRCYKAIQAALKEHHGTD